MFETFERQPADGLLALIKAFQTDERQDKIDLGVGVYRDTQGQTPVMQAVKLAERHLLETQESKRYLGPNGNFDFVDLLKPIIFGAETGLGERAVGIQTPGGSGALRLGAELIAKAKQGAKVWLGTPGWPNHAQFFAAGGVPVVEYGFVDLQKQSIDFDGLVAVLNKADEGDVILLHGCCHNPCGVTFSEEQWQHVASLLAERKLVPFIDLAYQGLGDGLEADASPMRVVLEAVDEALLAYSCDKNFALYRERVGALYLVGRDREQLDVAATNITALAGDNWSMPPDHGAAIVAVILKSDELKSHWHDELVGMCARVNGNRTALAAQHEGLGFIAQQRGLFSNLDMSREQAVALRVNHGIYFADSGRMNVAGMQPDDAEAIVQALKAEGVL